MVAEGFGYLLTADKNLQHQQNLDNFPITLVVLRIIDNRLKTLVSFVDIIRQSIQDLEESVQILEIDLRILTKE